MKNKLAMIARIILIALGMVCFIGTAFADATRTYNVQVLIFSHLTPATLQAQQWPVISSTINNSINTTPQPATALQSEKNALLRNGNYKILVDASWNETWNGNGTINIPVASANGKLNGNLAITLGHYFDVQANLLLTEPTSTLQKIDASNHYFAKWDQSHFTFQLLQHRRMRSNELNYLEHPLIGMLIKIIPVTPSTTVNPTS